MCQLDRPQFIGEMMLICRAAAGLGKCANSKQCEVRGTFHTLLNINKYNMELRGTRASVVSSCDHCVSLGLFMPLPLHLTSFNHISTH